MIEPDASETSTSYDRRLPLVLRPNRGPNFTWVLIFFGIIGFILYKLLSAEGLVITYVIDFFPTAGTWMERNLPWLGIALFVSLSVFGIWRELSYFRPGGSYFVGLSAEGVTISTPFKRRHFGWTEIERFRVGAARVSNEAGSKKSYTIRADLRDGGFFRSGIAIAQGDFAKDLGATRARSAEILCGFLNEVRDRVREVEFAGIVAVVPVPYGLHVVEEGDAATTLAEVSPRAMSGSSTRPAVGSKAPVRTPTVTRE